ncbi:MAG: hypothetical protein ACRDT6_03655 [Micromonosporaceae bacterium]
MSYQPYHPQPYPPAYPSPYARRTSAPFSVHVAAFFIYLGALALLLGTVLAGLLAAGATQLPTEDVPAEAATLATGAGVVVALVFLVFSLLYFLLARSLQKGRQWARVLVLIFAVLGLLGAIGQTVLLLSQLDNVTGPVLLGLGMPFLGPVFYLVLLNTSAARSWFRHQTY